MNQSMDHLPGFCAPRFDWSSIRQRQESKVTRDNPFAYTSDFLYVVTKPPMLSSEMLKNLYANVPAGTALVYASPINGLQLLSTREAASEKKEAQGITVSVIECSAGTFAGRGGMLLYMLFQEKSVEGMPEEGGSAFLGTGKGKPVFAPLVKPIRLYSNRKLIELDRGEWPLNLREAREILGLSNGVMSVNGIPKKLN
jgi:hypothetical protein